MGPAPPSPAQPVKAPRFFGSTGLASVRLLAARRRLAVRRFAARRFSARRFSATVVVDPTGGSDEIASTSFAPSAGVVVSVPPPPLVPAAQFELVIVFVSRLTAPVCARSLPWIVAAVLAVTVAR